MMKPAEIQKDLITVLDRSGFTTSQIREPSGLNFIIVSRRDDLLLLIKILIGPEQLTRPVAKDILNLSRVLKGSPILITPSTSALPFQDGVLYVRYGIPLMTFNTIFDHMIEEIPPMIYRGTNGFFVTLDGSLLRTRREALNISLGALAESVGVSRRAIQMYESGMGADIEIAIRVEKALKTPLILPLDPFSKSEDLQTIRDGLDTFEGMKKEVLEHLDSIGMEILPTQRCPFDALARGEEELLLTSFGGSKTAIHERAGNLSKISKVTGGDPLMVVPNSISTKKIGSTSVLKVSEIKSADNIERLVRLIRERS
jgi:putative transcriptional regulator